MAETAQWRKKWNARQAPVQVAVIAMAGWPVSYLPAQAAPLVLTVAEAQESREPPVAEAQVVPQLQSRLVELAMARAWG